MPTRGKVVHPLLSFDPVRIEATEGSGGLKMSALERGWGRRLHPTGSRGREGGSEARLANFCLVKSFLEDFQSKQDVSAGRYLWHCFFGRGLSSTCLPTEANPFAHGPSCPSLGAYIADFEHGKGVAQLEGGVGVGLQHGMAGQRVTAASLGQKAKTVVQDVSRCIH